MLVVKFISGHWNLVFFGGTDFLLICVIGETVHLRGVSEIRELGNSFHSCTYCLPKKCLLKEGFYKVEMFSASCPGS